MDPMTASNNNCLADDLNTKPKSDIEASSLKRKCDPATSDSPPKKQKIDAMPAAKPHNSPKKRIDIAARPPTKNKFIYGNYDRYYGYRNPKDFRDVRLAVFESHKELFAGKDVLDIGCNSGYVTIETAKNLTVKHIVGMDIDKALVNRTTKNLSKIKKATAAGNHEGFPFNISFVHGNYVLRDDVLLEIETPQFDVILCLSVTKWIHLNFGDAALKQAFRRMYAQLREGGVLILEAQPWEGYKRRKKLTPEIFSNYQSIVFKPKDFTAYLLSDEVGFKTASVLAVPDHCSEGFRRPIQIFSK